MIAQQIKHFPEAEAVLADPALAFSRRNWRGKYVQRLLLDTAHMLMGVLHLEGRTSRTSIGLIHTTEARSVVFNLGATEAQDASADIGTLNRLALLSDALGRQIYRLTGCTGFHLSTWDHYLLTQPVSLVLFTADGQELQFHNPTFAANTYFHGLIDLFDHLEAIHQGGLRTPGDLSGLTIGSEVAGWHVGPALRQPGQPHSSGGIALPSSASRLKSIRDRMTTGEVPQTVLDLEAYEASLERGVVRRTARFGQDDGLAVTRTERRFEALNANLVADLSPLSRSLKDTSPEELIDLANHRPLAHLAIEFGVSDVAINKRLKKLGWVSPRRKMRAK